MLSIYAHTTFTSRISLQMRPLEYTSFPPLYRSYPLFGGGHSNPLQYSCLKNSHGWRSLVGYSPWDCKVMDRTERLSTSPVLCCHCRRTNTAAVMTHIPTHSISIWWKKQARHNKTRTKTQPKILFAALPNVVNMEESRGSDSEWQHPSTYVFSSRQLHVSSTNKSARICEIVRASSGLPRWLSDRESTCNAGDLGTIPGLGRYPGGGHGNPLQYPCLGNPSDRGAGQATVHGVTKSRTQLSD